MALYLFSIFPRLSFCLFVSNDVIGSQHLFAFSTPVFESVSITTGKSLLELFPLVQT